MEQAYIHKYTKFIWHVKNQRLKNNSKSTMWSAIIYEFVAPIYNAIVILKQPLVKTMCENRKSSFLAFFIY